MRSIDQWCHDNRHLPISEQQHKLNQKLRGHYAYYGVTGNSDAMNRFRQEVENRWRKWLNRRNNIRSMHWQKFCALLRRYPLAPGLRSAIQASTSRSETMMRGTVCSSVGTYGSVGAAGWQQPVATRSGADWDSVNLQRSKN